MNKPNRDGRSFLSSLGIHLALCFLLAVAPAPLVLPEGTDKIVELDFVGKAPLGNQIRTRSINKNKRSVQPLARRKQRSAVQARKSPKPEDKKVPPIAKKVLQAKPEAIQKTVKTPPLTLSDKGDIPVKRKKKQKRQASTAPKKAPVKKVVKKSQPNKRNTKLAKVIPKSSKKFNSVGQKGGRSNVRGGSYQSDGAYGVPTGTRDVSEVKQAPGNRPPQYPQLSRANNEQGVVKLVYFVTQDGFVSNIQMAQSSGYEALDYEAIQAIGLYQFLPGQPGKTSHEVHFKLQGKKIVRKVRP